MDPIVIGLQMWNLYQLYVRFSSGLNGVSVVANVDFVHSREIGLNGIQIRLRSVGITGVQLG